MPSRDVNAGFLLINYETMKAATRLAVASWRRDKS